MGGVAQQHRFSNDPPESSFPLRYRRHSPSFIEASAGLKIPTLCRDLQENR